MSKAPLSFPVEPPARGLVEHPMRVRLDASRPTVRVERGGKVVLELAVGANFLGTLRLTAGEAAALAKQLYEAAGDAAS